jgi:Ala-tRNA(Pro) deacylase
MRPPLTPHHLHDLLSGRGIAFTTVTHPPLHTVEQSKALRGQIPGAHIKNLFLKDEKGALFLVVALESTKVDLKTLWRRLGCKRLSFGNPDLLWEVLGVRPGSVTPFALLNTTAERVRLVWDAALAEHTLIAAHPLHNEASTVLTQADLLALLADHGHVPTVLPLAADTA